MANAFWRRWGNVVQQIINTSIRSIYEPARKPTIAFKSNDYETEIKKKKVKNRFINIFFFYCFSLHFQIGKRYI